MRIPYIAIALTTIAPFLIGNSAEGARLVGKEAIGGTTGPFPVVELNSYEEVVPLCDHLNAILAAPLQNKNCAPETRALQQNAQGHWRVALPDAYEELEAQLGLMRPFALFKDQAGESADVAATLSLPFTPDELIDAAVADIPAVQLADEFQLARPISEREELGGLAAEGGSSGEPTPSDTTAVPAGTDSEEVAEPPTIIGNPAGGAEFPAAVQAGMGAVGVSENPNALIPPPPEPVAEVADLAEPNKPASETPAEGAVKSGGSPPEPAGSSDEGATPPQDDTPVNDSEWSWLVWLIAGVSGLAVAVAGFLVWRLYRSQPEAKSEEKHSKPKDGLRNLVDASVPDAVASGDFDGEEVWIETEGELAPQLHSIALPPEEAKVYDAGRVRVKVIHKKVPGEKEPQRFYRAKGIPIDFPAGKEANPLIDTAIARSIATWNKSRFTCEWEECTKWEFSQEPRTGEVVLLSVPPQFFVNMPPERMPIRLFVRGTNTRDNNGHVGFVLDPGYRGGRRSIDQVPGMVASDLVWRTCIEMQAKRKLRPIESEGATVPLATEDSDGRREPVLETSS